VNVFPEKGGEEKKKPVVRSTRAQQLSGINTRVFLRIFLPPILSQEEGYFSVSRFGPWGPTLRIQR